MPISDWIEKLGRVVFEAPFGSLDAANDVPELTEIRLALLDEIKDRSHRVARRYVFPYNVVRISLLGIPVGKESIFHGDFFPRYCEEELRSGLTRLGYRFPEELRVDVETSPELPQSGGNWVRIETISEPKPDTPQTTRSGALEVIKGTANVTRVDLTKARTNIGRSTEVYRTDGPSRKNDIAFDEIGEINLTVSREHAHVRYDAKSGQFRLFNDRGSNLWVIRDGLSQSIHKDARGFLLHPDDEIHLGRAIVRFYFGDIRDVKESFTGGDENGDARG